MTTAISARRVDPTPPNLREWHLLTPDERDSAWCELVDWVSWLYQRYELSTEERLPHCWAEHPGLVEELRALKAWREEIYTGTSPSGQAARYWHNEMRALIAAAGFYASGCRAGHRGAPGTDADTRLLTTRWHAADATTGIPEHLLSPGAATADIITESAMRAALAAGTAQPLSTTMQDIARHDGSWWRSGPLGWLRITDPEIADRCDESAKRLALADAAVRRRTRTGQAATSDTASREH